MNLAKIRYNTNFPQKSKFKWRLLWEEKQYLVDDIELYLPSFTSEDEVVGDDGNIVKKFHISCIPNSVEFEETTDKFKAIIK